MQTHFSNDNTKKITKLHNKFNKHLNKGRFYSVNRHPGLIVFKNDQKNIYIAVITGTSQKRHQTKLKYPTEKGIKTSFVNNRPV